MVSLGQSASIRLPRRVADAQRYPRRWPAPNLLRRGWDSNPRQAYDPRPLSKRVGLPPPFRAPPCGPARVLPPPSVGLGAVLARARPRRGWRASLVTTATAGHEVDHWVACGGAQAVAGSGCARRGGRRAGSANNDSRSSATALSLLAAPSTLCAALTTVRRVRDISSG
jgi:hypothetical protein